MRMVSLLVGLPLLAGCGQTPGDRVRSAATQEAARADLDRELAGLAPERPVQCLPTYARTDLRSYGTTLIYRVNNGLKYRSDTVGGCEGVAKGRDILVTRSPQGRTCAGDFASTVDRNAGFATGSCVLGAFVPYRRQ